MKSIYIIPLFVITLFITGCSSGPVVVQGKSFTPAYTSIVEKFNNTTQGLVKETIISKIPENRTIVYGQFGSVKSATTNVTEAVWNKYQLGDVWSEPIELEKKDGI